MTRSNFVLEFIAYVDTGYVELARGLWDDHSHEIAKRLDEDEAVQLYRSLALFDRNGLAERFYDIVTRLDTKVGRSVIVDRRFGPEFMTSY